MHSRWYRHSRKSLISWLLLLALLLAACAPAAPAGSAPASTGSEGGDTAASGEAESGEEEVTLQLWHHWSTSRHPLLQARVEAFMELYPNINVVETLQPQDGIVEKLLTAIAGGSAPDVAMLHRRNLQAFAAEGALLPIDSYIAEAGIEEGYWYPGEYSSNIFDGQIYGLPLTEGITFINYNLDMWEEAGLDPNNFPETWDEFLETAKQLTQYADNGQVDIAGFAVGDLGSSFLHWLVTNGQASIYSDDRTTAEIDTPQAIEVLAFIKRLTDEVLGGYQNLQAFTAASSGLDQPPFVMETAAMATGQAWQFLVINETNPDLNYRLARFPGGPSGDGPVATNQEAWSYVIPQGTQHPDEAWLLLKYLTVDEGAKQFLLDQGRASPVIEYNEAEEYAELPHWDEFLEVSGKSRTMGVSPVHPQVQPILAEMTERVVVGDMTPEEAAAWADAEVQSLLDEFWASR